MIGWPTGFVLFVRGVTERGRAAERILNFSRPGPGKRYVLLVG